MNDMVYEEADYVIVGGGSAGCVLANRLSERPDVKVLLLEAGPGATGLFSRMPAGSMKLMSSTATNWMFMTEPDASIGNRRIMWHSGRMLGGGSGLNGMVYIRGSRHDYDQWAELGCTGWSWDDVYPYFLRSESFEGPPAASHNKGGPLSVSPSRNPHPLVGAFVAGCVQAGIRHVPDYCNGDIDGVFENYLTQSKGRRSSTALSFLRLAIHRPNLKVITDVTADRILFANSQAVGVIVRRGAEELRVNAKREVLLSGGTMQSPALLLRSGIGPGAALQAMDIPVTVNIPGVGRNLHEHASFATSRFVNIPTFNTMASRLRMPLHLLNYALFGRGLLTTGPVLAMANFRSNPDEEQPDIKISLSPSCMDLVAMRPAAQPGMTIYANVSPPKSRGEIRLRSRDPMAHPLIDYRHLGDSEDQRKMVIAAKEVDRIFRSPALARYVTGRNLPRDLPRDDAEWLSLIKANVAIGYHPVGTCRMGIGDGAVVDPALKVRGVNGLRVIDASIMPIMPSANTNAPAIMVAEKGADMVKQCG